MSDFPLWMPGRLESLRMPQMQRHFLSDNMHLFYATAYYYNAPKWQKIKFFIHIFSPHTSINFSYIQKGCSNRYSPVVAAELSLLHVTVLDSGFATLCFHKCALMVNNFIEFAHFCQYIFFIHTDVI